MPPRDRLYRADARPSLSNNNHRNRQGTGARKAARLNVKEAAAAEPVKQELAAALHKAIKQFDASSVTFYIRDPFWPGELRLAYMVGVKIEEPMYGFNLPSPAKKVICEGDTELFSTDAENDSRLREPVTMSSELIPPEYRYLFGDFVEREGVKSCARIMHIENDKVESVLFVNFSRRVEFDKSLIREIKNIFLSLVRTGLIRRLSSETRESDITFLYESMEILTPAHEAMAGLPAESSNNLKREMKDYFGSLLCSALDAIGINPKAGLGSLHLYQPETATLNLAAQWGKIQYKRKAASHSVSNGQGIISWVARRRRALLIHDINDSRFRSIYVRLNDDIRSELAVPMLAGNDLLGVLNLECTESRAFSAHNVKSVWHAASWAATAYRFYQQSLINREQKQFTERLLQLCWETTTNTNGVEASLNTLSTLTRDCLRAAKCDIWQYNSALGKFNNAGASYPDFSTQTGPRKRGWTEFILRTGQPIWIKDIESESSYKILFGSEGTWTDEVPASALPDNLHPRVIDLKVRCELGVPITVADRCSGVAWLKYDNDVQPPTPDDMKMVNGLAGQTGLVMECLARREDMVSHDAVQRISEQLTKNLFSTGPIKLEGFPRIEGYLISKPHHSNVGGDFCTSVRIDEQIVGILFGDGENHGITGALNMLPLITTFKAFGKETRSTTHMMDKLMSISKTIGVRGTAVYAIFTLIQDKLWLSVTSAGHPSLIIIRGNHPTFLPTDNGPADGPMLGVPELKEPLAAQRTQLHEGDMLILFTDGICKSPNPFTQRLEIATAALEAGKRDPQMIAQAIFDRAMGGNNNAFEDDATVLTLLIKK